VFKVSTLMLQENRRRAGGSMEGGDENFSSKSGEESVTKIHLGYDDLISKIQAIHELL